MKDYSRLELRVLLELYMEEAKDFSSALNNGASWEILRDKRVNIKLLSEFINRKYKEQYYSSMRRRNQPPHGD